MTSYTGIATLLHEADDWVNPPLLCTFAFFPLPLLEEAARGSETFSYLYSCTHLAYTVVLLKMYLAQENTVKSQLAKISRKLWLLLGYKMPWLLRLPSAYE